MGQPKALVPVDGIPMGRRAADALRTAGADPVVSIGGDPAWADALSLTIVADRWPGRGPVGGIATALLEAPVDTEVVLVVACDQPWLEPVDLARLAAALVADPTLDVVVGRAPRHLRQPFPSAWRPSLGPALADMVAAGRRRLLGVLDELAVGTVTLDPRSMLDVDEPDDLATP